MVTPSGRVTPNHFVRTFTPSGRGSLDWYKSRTVPVLVNFLKNSDSDDVRAKAAVALGQKEDSDTPETFQALLPCRHIYHLFG